MSKYKKTSEPNQTFRWMVANGYMYIQLNSYFQSGKWEKCNK